MNMVKGNFATLYTVQCTVCIYIEVSRTKQRGTVYSDIVSICYIAI